MENDDQEGQEELWRLVSQAIEKEGISYGDVIEHKWIYDKLGLDMPHDDMSHRDAKKIGFEYMVNIESLKHYLLTEKNMLFASVPAVGYKIIQPKEQTQHAENKFQSSMKKEINRAAKSLLNVDHSHLTARESQENAAAMARLGGRKAMLDGSKKDGHRNLSNLELEEEK